MADLPPDAVVGIVAGGGAVPGLLRAHLIARSHAVRTLALAGESPLAEVDATHPVGDVEGVLRSLARLGVTHAVLIGWVRRRPPLREVRLGWRALRAAPRLLGGLTRGDDAVLRAAVGAIEATGVRVLGVQELWPELVCGAGPASRLAPRRADRDLITRAAAAAHALGAHDVGQAVVAVGRRVVAVEGLEGTDAMLARVAALRAEGRIAHPGGVLVKIAKPGQELRADLPSIGPDTVEGAHAAGLAGIAVEAGRSLLIERERALAQADAHGLFVTGIDVTGGEA